MAVVLLVVASTVTVADNGLAFTSVAERAGSYWSGRALGVQNTAQYLTAAAVAPVAGLAITMGVRRRVRSRRTVPRGRRRHWCRARTQTGPSDPPVTDTGGRSLHC